MEASKERIKVAIQKADEGSNMGAEIAIWKELRVIRLILQQQWEQEQLADG